MDVAATALAAIPAASRVYLDTNIWIYALEGFAPFRFALAALFARIDSGELTAITSELTLAEALVKPLSLPQPRLEQLYVDTLQSGATLTMAPITREILIEAARVRAKHASLKLADAIHAATSSAHRADVFVTNDSRFGSVSGLRAVLLRAT